MLVTIIGLTPFIAVTIIILTYGVIPSLVLFTFLTTSLYTWTYLPELEKKIKSVLDLG